MWPFSEPSLETATRISDIANLVLIASLLGGVLSTYVIVQMGNVKESHWDRERDSSKERIAQLDNETARLRAQEALTIDSLLANAQAGRSNALAAEATRSVTEAMAVAQGFAARESTSETTRSLYIVPKVKPFAGKQFDAAVTSVSITLGGVLGSLKSALKIAGWIEIERSDPTAGVGLLSMDRASGPALVRIDVDASKDSELLDAAETLASALNAEGIAAVVNPKAETDAANAGVIHIVVGPKK